ncbi:hypothetical protein [Mycobacterium sp. E2989]|uniref:hypothetical protein n=1 Tax=Mycobacterium sp. E2989 TaxID=1834140 RepID=UPI0018D42D4C|nr:hypothetical protein [Mycobacterium sp. E2989]
MSPTMNSRGARRGGETPQKSLRSKKIRALIVVALAIPLLLGAGFILLERLHSTAADALDHPANPVGDDQSRAQVVQSTQSIVATAGLRASSAGYSLMSCKNRDDPPYQGAIYLTFWLPDAASTDNYFAAIAASLTGHGWAEGLPPNNHPLAKTFTKDAVTAIVYRHDDDLHLGVVRVYGECRNMNDHRRDVTAWTDITEQFAKTG